MTNSKNKPALTLTDGPLKAVIWRNKKEDGVFYSVTFSRSYKSANGEFRTATNFSGADLLKVGRLAERAYEYAAGLTDQAAHQPR